MHHVEDDAGQIGIDPRQEIRAGLAEMLKDGVSNGSHFTSGVGAVARASSGPRCRQVTPTRALLGGFPEGPSRVIELEVGDLGDLELRGAGAEQRGGQRDRDGHEAGADREGELVAVDQRRGA